MTQQNEQGAAKAAPIAPGSAILAMHWQHERTMATYDRLNALYDSASENDRFLNDLAQRSLLDADDALRLAILHMVPANWDEAAALAYHTSNAYDQIADREGKDWNENEAEAVRIAIQNLFDFMVGEKVPQPERLGRWFAAEAKRAMTCRRRRDGCEEA